MKTSLAALSLSFLLVGALAGAAISDEAKKCDLAKCRELLKMAQQHAQATSQAIREAKDECEKAQPSEDKHVLKGAVNKARVSLGQAKEKEDALEKQLNSLDFEFHAPIAY